MTKGSYFFPAFSRIIWNLVFIFRLYETKTMSFNLLCNSRFLLFVWICKRTRGKQKQANEYGTC
uniref:Uncharacterized protein n=1 Tax=Arundo donax TaxID=35708 RepID=A0A0A9B831_ARUDO